MNRRNLLALGASIAIAPRFALANETDTDTPELLELFQPTDDKEQCVRKWIRQYKKQWDMVKNIGVFVKRYKGLDDLDILVWLNSISRRLTRYYDSSDEILEEIKNVNLDNNISFSVISKHNFTFTQYHIPTFEVKKYVPFYTKSGGQFRHIVNDVIVIDAMLVAPYSFFRTEKELIVIDSMNIFNFCNKTVDVIESNNEEQIKWVS